MSDMPKAKTETAAPELVTRPCRGKCGAGTRTWTVLESYEAEGVRLADIKCIGCGTEITIRRSSVDEKCDYCFTPATGEVDGKLVCPKHGGPEPGSDGTTEGTTAPPPDETGAETQPEAPQTPAESEADGETGDAPADDSEPSESGSDEAASTESGTEATEPQPTPAEDDS